MVLTRKLSLLMIQVLLVIVDTVADLMAAPRPIEVEHILILWIAPVVGHERVLHAERIKSTDLETRPAAFETALAVGARDLEYVQADVLVETILFHLGAVGGVAEIGIQNQVTLQHVSGGDAGRVG